MTNAVRPPPTDHPDLVYMLPAEQALYTRIQSAALDLLRREAPGASSLETAAAVMGLQVVIARLAWSCLPEDEVCVARLREHLVALVDISIGNLRAAGVFE